MTRTKNNQIIINGNIPYVRIVAKRGGVFSTPSDLIIINFPSYLFQDAIKVKKDVPIRINFCEFKQNILQRRSVVACEVLKCSQEGMACRIPLFPPLNKKLRKIVSSKEVKIDSNRDGSIIVKGEKIGKYPVLFIYDKCDKFKKSYSKFISFTYPKKEGQAFINDQFIRMARYFKHVIIRKTPEHYYKRYNPYFKIWVYVHK